MRHDTAGMTLLLQDAHAMEVGALEALDTFNNGYASIEACRAVDNYRSLCEGQVRSVSKLLESLGARTSSAKNFVHALVGKASDWMNVAHSDDDKPTLLLVRFYGMAQTKGALYDAITAYAETMGDAEIAKLAREHREQEFAAAEVLFPFIWDAASYVDPNTKPPDFML